ncbi:MAG TPA: hypothetical protein VN370_11880 [Desulfitobacteriaceae bacterium]|nr:hypothetical protein [Desulfitobacteriaceae bacterium]
MKRNAAMLLISSLFIAVVLTGCSQGAAVSDKESSTKNNTSGKLIEPSELISKAEAEQLLGESLQEAKNSEQKVVGLKISNYDAVKEDTFKFLQVSLTQQAFMPDNGQSSQAIFRALRDNFPANVKVDGVGDEAFIAPPGIHILKGSYYILIAVGNSDDVKNREILISAAKKALENLEKLKGN